MIMSDVEDVPVLPQAQMKMRTCCVCGAKGRFDSYICPKCAAVTATSTTSGKKTARIGNEDESDAQSATTSTEVRRCPSCLRVYDPRNDRWKIPSRTPESFKKRWCPECWRAWQGYFEAVLQIIGIGDGEEYSSSKAEIERLIQNVLTECKKQGRHACITKVTGHSYFLSNLRTARTIARKISKSFGATVKETAKLVGRDRQKSVDKFKVAIRVELGTKRKRTGKDTKTLIKSKRIEKLGEKEENLRNS